MKTVDLDLTKYCIETETRRRYHQTISEYFKAARASPLECRDLEGQLELLKTALESLDFNRLRDRFPELRGGSAAEVKLQKADDDGPLLLFINGNKVDPLLE